MPEKIKNSYYWRWIDSCSPGECYQCGQQKDRTIRWKKEDYGTGPVQVRICDECYESGTGETTR